MTTEKVSDNSTETSTVYLIAERMDAKNRLLAKRLHELGYIYALYGALDGLSLSYSMIKYLFDMLFANSDVSSSDLMHEWMMTSEGMIIAASSSLTLISFSLIANHHCKEENKNRLKAFIAIVWPYGRDAMKGLKNAYKGFRSILQAAQILSGENLGSLIVPVGLVLGILSAANRIWYRYHVNERKDMMKANAIFLTNIQAEILMSAEKAAEWQKILAEIGAQRSQAIQTQHKMFLSAAYGGIVDGLYLYLGTLALCSFAPVLLATMTVFSAIYFLACIASRLYEEYDFQRRLDIAQTKIELAFYGKQLETKFCLLRELAEQISKAPSEGEEARTKQQEHMKELCDLYLHFEEKRNHLNQLSTLSYGYAFLSGMKNGLAAYGALSSGLFAVSIFLVLASTNLPPILLISSISFGMVLLSGFIAHSMLRVRHHQLKIEQMTSSSNMNEKKLQDILKTLKEVGKNIADLKPDEIKRAILDGMSIDPSPQFFFQEWFEIVRSFFSGMGKGSKAVDFTLSNLQERDAAGHYHDTPIMLLLMVVSVLIHALALALRALARAFGRDSDGLPSVVNASETYLATTFPEETSSSTLQPISPDSPTPLPSVVNSSSEIPDKQKDPNDATKMQPKSPTTARSRYSIFSNFPSLPSLPTLPKFPSGKLACW
jgi:hypothetical protein